MNICIFSSAKGSNFCDAHLIFVFVFVFKCLNWMFYEYLVYSSPKGGDFCDTHLKIWDFYVFFFSNKR